MRTIIFKHNRGIGSTPTEEEFEFKDDVTDAEIHKEFEEWVWQQIGDYVTWYDKE